MAGPQYKPDDWNKPEIKAANNCYNYATNNKFAPKPGQTVNLPAIPGKKKKIMPYFVKGYVNKQYRNVIVAEPQFEVVCEGIATATKQDGIDGATLDKDKKPTCAADCWLVAYYARAAEGVENGDFHFVRQDSDGGWSHMPAWGGGVTRNKYDPAKNNYDKDDPIKDPEHDNVGKGYKFCAYLCCCPNTTVASLLPSDVGTGREVAVTVCTTSLGRSTPFAPPYTAAEMQATLSSLITPLGTNWSNGFGDGRLLYRIDFVSQIEEQPHTTVFVTDSTYTVWDGTARHLPDPYGMVATQLDDVFGRGAGPAGSAPRHGPPMFRRTILTRSNRHHGFVIEGPHRAEHWLECCIKTVHSCAHGVHRTSIVIIQSQPPEELRYDLPCGSEVLIYPNGDLVIQIV
jgi:hypothetical protein